MNTQPVIHGRRDGLCFHHWIESGSADFHCAQCGAWYSYDPDDPDPSHDTITEPLEEHGAVHRLAALEARMDRAYSEEPW